MTYIKELGRGLVVEKTGSGSFPAVGFDISGVKYTGSPNRVLLSQQE
jgi:hypothetical protein